jgi:hypothetical protein
MALTTVNIATPAAESIFTDTAMGSTVDAVKASSALVFSVLVDNSANGGAASYVKLWNVASGSVTVGTTAPDEVIYVPAGARITHVFYTSAAVGKTFGTALSAACVTTGGTGGVTAPASAVVVTINFQ